MKLNSLGEAIKDYERKTGEKYYKPDNYHRTTTDGGFFIWRVEWPILWINQVCGDGKFWRDYAYSLAFLFNCRYMRTYTRRNPLVFQRKWGAKIIDTKQYNDYTEHLLEVRL